MLRDGSSRASDEDVWCVGGDEHVSTRERGATDTDVDEVRKRIDRTLRGIAKTRAGLDAREAKWLREAERVQLWKRFGMVNMIDYMERVLGHAPRTAQQRMQVARALEHLPEITEALTTGELPFSAVRELVRVATPETEAAWRAHVGGMNLRQVEETVAGHKPGDQPTDAPDPELRTHRVVLELGGAAYALWRQACLALDEMHECHLDDDARATAMASAVLERCCDETNHPSNIDEASCVSKFDETNPESSCEETNRPSNCPSNIDETNRESNRDERAGGGSDGRARYQIALTVCRRCDQAWQEGGGVKVPVDAATLERARCDAQHIGSLDGEGPERAHQDIPPSVDRFVRRRDGGRCQTPGCRSALGLEIHHIVHREHGGTHAPSNLTLRCSACHDAHHRGLITISGTAPDRIVTTRLHETPSAHVGAARPAASPPSPPAAHLTPPTSRFEQAAMQAQARDALVAMGWKRGLASAAVDEARASGCEALSLVDLIREALRRCPQ